MIKINSEQICDGYDVSVLIKSNKLQLTCEVKTLLERMIKDESELLNAVINVLMPMITESTYNMDPETYAVYVKILENML